MFHRLVEPRLHEALTDTPVVLLVGPRRAGKTTLVRGLGSDRRYLTLDDQTTLEAARADPVGFIRGLDRVTLDEIQRAPDLLLAIKKSVDEDPRPGRFLLTGSADVMTLPKVADSLAGRIETLQIGPLSRAEVVGVEPGLISRLVSGDPPEPNPTTSGRALLEVVLAGGFPEVIARPTERRRTAWARAYLDSVLTRDLRDIADLDRMTELPRFVRYLAEHTGQLINYSAFGSEIGVSYKTAQRYLGLLEQVFLVTVLPPWSNNRIKRLVKASKPHFIDCAIMAAARGLSLDRVLADRNLTGALLENFVVAEVLKQLTWSHFAITPYHFRDHAGHEVDLVLERDDGMIVGIEVKAGATVRPDDFRGLRALAAASGDRFLLGLVVHDSEAPGATWFGNRLAATAISNLWG